MHKCKTIENAGILLSVTWNAVYHQNDVVNQ